MEGVLPEVEVEDSVEDTVEETPDVSFEIDPTVQPKVNSLDGAPVGAVREPDGTQYDFIANEIILKVDGQEELEAFIAKYRATVVRDDAPLVVPGMPQQGTPARSGYYLLRIDPATTSPGDAGQELAGFRFSSEETARTFAIALREKSGGAEVNAIQTPAASLEHPKFQDDDGNIVEYVDAEKFAWFIEDGDPSTEEDEDYSIGVTHAWEYLGYHGILEIPGNYFMPIIAIVDDGFDLDPVTGVPLNGNLDYNTLGAPLQADLVDNDGTAGGRSDLGSPWHGQSSFGAAAAYPKNRYGSAGSGGHFVRPMLVRGGTLFSSSAAIRWAADNGANIINTSWHQKKKYDVLTDAVNHARSKGAVVVAAAGNGVEDPKTGQETPTDLAETDVYPCENDGVICVGGMDPFRDNVFNWGDSVDIWGPDLVFSTPNPDTTGAGVGLAELPVFTGTSASAPFVAGVIGLMKAAMPEIGETQIVSVLQATANASPDEKVQNRGIDAYRAVRTVLANDPPVVTITQPQDGQSIGWKTQPLFKCTYVDPEVDPTDVARTNRFHGVVIFSSDFDGELCRSDAPPYNCFSAKSELTIGPHTITATAVDPFEGVSTHQIRVNVVNSAPQPEILKPLATDALFSHIPVFFNGFVPDPDEQILDADVFWTSSIDGLLGPGRQLTHSLSAGTHTITLTAVDGKGLIATDEVTVTVNTGAGSPVPVITKPDISGLVFGPGQVITLEGFATDPEDGALPGTSLEWSSDVDGVLGAGNSIQVTLSAQSDPCIHSPHTITLKATDSDGHVVTVTITIYVGIFC
jgi:hypothetical protein